MNDKEFQERFDLIKEGFKNDPMLEDLDELILHIRVLTAVTSKTNDIKKLEDATVKVVEAIETLQNFQKELKDPDISTRHQDVVDGFSELKETFSAGIQALFDKELIIPDNKDDINAVEDAIKQLKLNPNIEVKPTDVELDLTPLLEKVEALSTTVENLRFPETDLSMLEVQMANANQKLEELVNKKIPVPEFNSGGIIRAIENSASNVQRLQIDGLSFSETLGAFGTYMTDWVDITQTNTLDITANVASTSAVTAVIEYTNAADPNTTPPGVNDVTRSTSTTIAGGSLGGIDEPGFALPAQLSWCRISVTDLTGGQDIDVSVYDHDTPPTGAQLPLIAGLTDDFKAPIGRSVAVGKDPDGDYSNLRVNGTRSEDTSEDSGTLPSGATPTYDPANTIVAANVIDTGWLATEGYDYNNFRALFNVQGVKIFLIDASDTSGNNSTTTNFNFPTATTPAFGSINVGARLFQAYFRIIIFNDTGTDATSWAYRSTWLTQDNGSIVLSLDQPILDFFPAPIVQSISKGQQPDGDYVALPADGGAVETSTPLTASATYTSDWTDTDGYKSIEVYVSTDQVSASDGIEIQYTDDAQATTPTAYPGDKRTFTTQDVANGFKIVRVSTALDGFRVKYTNGGTGQGSFFLAATLKTGQAETAQDSVKAEIGYGNLGSNTKAVVHGDNGVNMVPIAANADDELKVVHEKEVEVANFDSVSDGGSVSITNTATQFAATPPSNAYAIMIQGDPSNNKVIALGTNSAVTSGNKMHALSAGASVTYPVDGSGNSFYGIVSSGSETINITWLVRA